MSTVAGLHVPVIPFVDTLLKAGTVPPAHMVSEDPKLNVGVILAFTVTFRVKGSAQRPAEGVNV